MKGTSNELQEVSLVALVNDPYLLSKCIGEVTEYFYENLSYRLIFICIKEYYNKYMIIPTDKELKLVVEDKYKEDYGDIEDVYMCIDKIYSQKVASEDFIYSKMIDFIRRNRIEKSLNNVVKYMESGEVDLDAVAVELKNSVNMTISKAKVHNLSDIESIKEIREEALGSDENPIIIKFFIDKVNKNMQYGGFTPKTVNLVTAPPGNGKTTMLINQGMYTAQQGYKCLHVFLGDMTNWDAKIRYLSCLSGIPTKTIISFTDEELVKFIQKYNMSGMLSNLYTVAYAADELTASGLIEEIGSIQKDMRIHFDCIIIDYDENLAEEEDNMYKSGGQIYNKIALFAAINRSVIFVAAQPKPQYWKCEVIPLEAAAESSKKAKIIDSMITLGKPGKTSEVGTLFIAKNRRGDSNSIMRLGINGENARMKHITEDEYNRIKSSERSSYLEE